MSTQIFPSVRHENPFPSEEQNGGTAMLGDLVIEALKQSGKI